MKKVVYLSMIAISAGIVAFIITLAKYDFYIDEQREIIPIRIDSEKEFVKAESSIRINPEAIVRDEKKVVEKPNDILNFKKQVEETAKEVSAKPKREIVFAKPCEGKIITAFSGEELILSKTLKEWTIHNGVDISVDLGEAINSICDGEITNIKYDYKYGNIIEMKSGEYFVKYACIEPLKSLKIGDKIEGGQQIAAVSDDMGYEISEGPHLHLEIFRNDVQIDPVVVIQNI